MKKNDYQYTSQTQFQILTISDMVMHPILCILNASFSNSISHWAYCIAKLLLKMNEKWSFCCRKALSVLKKKIREVLQCSIPEFLRKVKARTEMKVGHSERKVKVSMHTVAYS